MRAEKKFKRLQRMTLNLSTEYFNPNKKITQLDIFFQCLDRNHYIRSNNIFHHGANEVCYNVSNAID